ncbi:MFS transporter [Pseudomonas resinovorans]|uniref:MFS transporter n=1 Tax=Metapseudomonas resinovorans TaxID=53412 RepID=A0ABT4Y5K9_METRE|nr:MFS transporter [Pseudomonas resinovorans]MDA8484061.1 MFS transporter [Pseudomonas resinovorans]
MTFQSRQPLALQAAIVVFAAITSAVLLTAPAIATRLAVELGLTPEQIGNLFSIELGAMSLATLPSFWWLKRVDCRRAALIAALLFIAGNLASAATASYLPLAALRFVTALAGGSLMVLCLSCAATLPNPSRAYGFWVLGQLVLGAIGLSLLPRLFEAYGLGVVYLLLATLTLLGLPLVRAFPAAHRAPERPARSGSASRWKVAAAILGLLGFYVALSAVWTFIGAIGAQAGLNAQASGDILAIATLMGIAGAGCATLIGERLPRTPLLCSGFGLMVAATLLLLDQPQLARFAVAVLLFKFTWTYVLPFILASLVELDESGRLMSLSNLVIGSGLALGPAMAGRLLGDGGDFRSLLLAAGALTTLSLLATLGSRLRPASLTTAQSL